MSRSRYKIYESEYPYFITSSFVKGYPLFAHPDVARIILDGLQFLQDQREVTLYAYVLMENHLHYIASGEILSRKLRHFNSYTAREIIDTFNQKKRTRLLRQLSGAKANHKRESSHQVWQEGFHPKQIVGDKMMVQKIEYIHNNPVKRGYVDHPEDWRYSSARNYVEVEGLIPVTLFNS
jgi:REP element-mobilizing transposase RayT